MTGQGVSSRSSHSAAAGRMVRSANSWTHFWICSWSSFSASEKSPMSAQLRFGSSGYYSVIYREVTEFQPPNFVTKRTVQPDGPEAADGGRGATKALFTTPLGWAE